VLALHLNRSIHFGQFASKNTIKVHFPEVLDLSPYTTSGSLSTVPTSAISTPSPPPPSLQTSLFHQTPLSSFSSSSTAPSTSKSKKRSTTPTPDAYHASSSPYSPAPETQRTIYRLTAVVCHYGQHSFGHYICYRRKPRIGRDKRKLAGEVPVLVMPEGDDEETEEESDSRSRSRSRSRSKGKGKGKVDNTTSTNGYADPYSAYSHLSPQPSSSYHWQDHSETLSGSGKGWLRISDDSVVECGIESVMAEGSGAFMLYYERAVWDAGWMNLKEKEGEKTPINGVGVLDHLLDGKSDSDVDDVDLDGDGDGDGDRFSIGSEETLRPKIKIIDLNGSVGSLVSEVGVGIRKQKKNGKGGHGLKMKDEARESSMSVNASLYASSVSSSSSSTASSSKNFGPRIVRSVNARRHSVGMNGSAIPVSEIADGPLINGATQRDDQERKEYNPEGVQWDMTASAPSLQASNLTNNSVKSTNQMGLGSKSTKMMMRHTATATNP
jgi:ubiquitin carboxyl-terminal hydrolase 1